MDKTTSKKHIAPGVDHIPSELIQAGGSKLYKEIHKLIVLMKFMLLFSPNTLVF